MVMSRRLVCVCGDGTSGKVVVGHGVGVGIAVGRGVNFERMARGVQLFPGETHSIAQTPFARSLTNEQQVNFSAGNSHSTIMRTSVLQIGSETIIFYSLKQHTL